MTTDELRRMLELAAKAMGYVATESLRNGEFRVHDESDQYWSFAWQPHTDDGDSARMRTALRMNVIWSDTAVHCLNSMGGSLESFSDHNGDRNAAMRLCALKVAAMIEEGIE